jgi:hypothetical protein
LSNNCYIIAKFTSYLIDFLVICLSWNKKFYFRSSGYSIISFSDVKYSELMSRRVNDLVYSERVADLTSYYLDCLLKKR